MKMEHSVRAPLAGTVSAVKIAPGQQVAEGAVALVIEPDVGK
jgi:3-methylcrotonyl-CoA carboxylase alpha subunit